MPSSLWTRRAWWGQVWAAARVVPEPEGARNWQDGRGHETGLARQGGATRTTHPSPSLSHDKLTGGLLLTLTQVKFKASPGRRADALVRIVTLVGGTSRTGQRKEAQR